MCDFEDVDIISRYSRKQAVADGILLEILRFNGKPVMATIMYPKTWTGD